jgi:hypothetical protein
MGEQLVGRFLYSQGNQQEQRKQRGQELVSGGCSLAALFGGQGNLLFKHVEKPNDTGVFPNPLDLVLP